MQPVFRFAPSPNGALHLGHAYSALLNFELAKRMNGRFLIRLEDIDVTRCTKERITQMLEDLHWLGLEWEEPILSQSSRFAAYHKKLQNLKDKGLIYPSHASRNDIKKAVLKAKEDKEKAAHHTWPNDPDGAPLYPRHLLHHKEDPTNQPDNMPPAWRLDMAKVLTKYPQLHTITWSDIGYNPDPEISIHNQRHMDPQQWGDVILSRKDCPTSYHLAVTLDDAIQDITHIVRGQDLFWATGLHRLLQHLFALPEPRYFHHQLFNNEKGEKLSKSCKDISLKALRDQNHSLDDIKAAIQLDAPNLHQLDHLIKKWSMS